MIRINYIRVFSHTNEGVVSIPSKMILKNSLCDTTFSINTVRSKLAKDLNKKESDIEFIHTLCHENEYFSHMLKCVTK